MTTTGLFEVSETSRLLASRLARIEDDETITYEDLERLVGKPIDEVRSNIGTARAIINREHGIILETIPKVGYRRTKDYAAVGQRAADLVGRRAKRARRSILRAIEAAPPSAEDAPGVYAKLASLGAVEHFTTSKVARQLESHIANNGDGELPLAKTLAMFGKN